MISQDWLREHFHYENGKLIRVKTYGAPGRNRRVGIQVGSVDRQGYLTTMILGKTYKLHRLVWFYFHGEWPAQLDHKNSIPGDNRIENLRACTHAENCWNRDWVDRGVQRANDTSLVRWKAYIAVNGKRIYLGRFKTKAEALKIRKEAEKKFHGEFAKG